MRSLWPRLASWIDSGKPFALATVTSVSGSSPRSPGAVMAVDPEENRFIGSVSSGCLELETIEAARLALRTGDVQRLKFGPDGLPPWSDGLSCGGWIEVRVEPWWGCSPQPNQRPIATLVQRWLQHDQPGVILSDNHNHLAINPADSALVGATHAFDPVTIAHARDCLRRGVPPAEIESDRGPVFIRTVRAKPRLLLVGGPELAVSLIPLAHTCGFATILLDPRDTYTAPSRFPHAPGATLRAWPNQAIPALNLGPRDAALVISHDPKIDDAALLALLPTQVGYIGALGSTRSHRSRLDRLRYLGAPEDALTRINGPAGIHLGTPDSVGIAVGILAGILQWSARLDRPG